MEDDKIVKNMKEALKRAKKLSRGKSKSRTGSDSIGEELGNQLMKNWVFSSPPSTNGTSQSQSSSTASKSDDSQQKQEMKVKVNAFEKLMAKRHEPLTPISPPETINVKKKSTRKSRKPKLNNLDDEENTSMDHSSNSIRKFFHGSTEKVNDDDENSTIISSTKKRNRNSTEEPEPPPVVETPPKASKRRKTKLETFELDSNENLTDIESPSIYQSGRPRRSCAGQVKYDIDEILQSPEKKKVQRPKKDTKDDAFLIDDDESPIKPKKLAPLFVKRMPKPVIDPAVQEARRNFLFSDLPEDLRQSIDKQREFENEILTNELVAFPTVSHVTGPLIELNSVDWTNSRVKLNQDDEDDEIDCQVQHELYRGRLTDCKSALNPASKAKVRSKASQFRVEWSEVALKTLKKTVEQRKKDFGDFPTNRCFKQLFPKFQQHSAVDEDDNNLLFVDVLKPSVLSDFVIGKKPTEELHNFLQSWNEKTEEYESTDDESYGSSRQSSKGSNNFAVLTGSSGSGKTLAVYAMANELNFRVIEVNAGARRSGKIMLQELQEATQSHRVKQDSEESTSDGQKSVILIEDAELVFESDDGFVSAIQQLINISKRPVILTTSNSACSHLQKFINHNEIAFDLSSTDEERVGKYLSLLCLAANYRIDCSALRVLFMANGRDMRKTINEIEFFIRSRSDGNENDADDDLLDFYLPNRHHHRRRPTASGGKHNNNIDDDTSSAHFELTMMSSWMLSDGRKEQEDDLIADMKCFVVERCRNVMNSEDAMHKIIQNNSTPSTCTASSIASHLISPPSASNGALITDYAPILRDMCRSEKARLDAGRRTSSTNRGHYLRHLIALNSFGNDYFNEQTEMFPKLDD